MTSTSRLRKLLGSARILIAIAAMAGVPATVAASTIVGGTINANTTWSLAGSPYLAMNPVFVNNGATLTIEAGVVVKFKGTFGYLVVFSGGTLVANGVEGNRVIFTSMQDDSVGGDSGGDGATTGAPGQWYMLGVNGTLILRYADVRYGGWGSSNEAYGGVSVYSGGFADLDHCALYLNQRSGITVGAGTRAVVAHSQLTQNAVGASAYNAELTIRANSSLSSNTHTGLFLNVTDSYAGVPSSILNSDVANNGEYGVRLIMNTTLPAAAAPYGHENNIFNNKAGAPQRQLFILWPLVQSSWTDNYWGAVSDPIPCLWAPPETTGMHLAFGTQSNYCQAPPDGPTTNSEYVLPGCPDNKPMRCRADYVSNIPYSSNPIDNSNK
jgi:hypothetical protein